MKVLVVDPDLKRAPGLKETLAADGAEVTMAASGSFALTMLEWNRHDVVVSRARIDDMDGHELCAILKADPGTRDVRFVLLAGADEVSAADTAAAGVDLVLPSGVAGQTILPLVVRLVEADRVPAPAPVAALPAPVVAPAPAMPEIAPLRDEPAVPRLRPERVAQPEPEPPRRYATAASAAAAEPWSPKTSPMPPVPVSPAPPPAPAPAPGPVPVVDLMAMPGGTFQGSLDVMDLADLTQAIAGGGTSGRLILALAHGGGLIAFEKGRVVHAEYRNTVGEAAFGSLLAAAHGDGAGRFCFLPAAAGESPTRMRTIDKSVDRLLLSIATAIDEKG